MNIYIPGKIKKSIQDMIWLKIIFFLTLIFFINYLFGCTNTFTKYIKPEKLTEYPEIRISHITLKDGTGIVFNAQGGKLSKSVQKDSTYYIISGNNILEEPVNVYLDQTLDIGVEKKEFDLLNTCISIIYYIPPVAITGFLILVVISGGDASGGSCPFVYSYNGKNFIFDTECYTGATSQALEKIEYSKLRNLREEDNTYQILLKSDPRSEIQYTDWIALRIVDFERDYEIYCNNDGKLFGIKNSIPPESVIDDKGNNITTFFNSPDNVSWQSLIPKDFNHKVSSLHNTLIFTFPLKTGMKNSKLLIKAGSTFWANEMTGRFAKLLEGSDSLEGIRKDNLSKFHLLQENEELYKLKINILEGNNFRTVGTFTTGGGALELEQVIDLDLRNYQDDSIKIMINPPLGFWKIDYIGLVNNYLENIKYRDIQPAKVIDNHNLDLAELLKENDKKYFVMSEAQDWGKLTFKAPRELKDKKRTIFFISSGYYEKIFTEKTYKTAGTLNSFYNGQKTLSEYSIDEYLEWLNKYSDKFNENK